MAEILALRSVLLMASLAILVISVMGLVTSVKGESIRNTDLGREKRRGKRSKSNVLFDLDDGAGGFTPGNARLVDISAWGVCIASQVRLEEGQMIRGRIRTPESPLLQITGRVVWKKPKHSLTLYGISFDQTTRLSE